MIRLALAVCAASWLAGPASAAGFSVSATLNNHRVVLGDQLVLSVTIAGSGTASPKPPLIPDVEIYESGKSQSMTIVGGRVSSTVVLTYVLNPKKSGRFVVPPLQVAGAEPTAPIAFHVDPAPREEPAPPAQAPAPPAAPAPPSGSNPEPPPAARPGPTPDAFVTAQLEKSRAFVNEQVTLVVRFYTAVPLLGAPQYDAPKLTGLLSENLGAEGQGQAVIGGRAYNYSELKSALFPVQAGRATIGPAVVTVNLPRPGAATGDDFFDRFFSMPVAEARRLHTDPLVLQAEPLPAGAPEDFSGIVGALTIESSVDRLQLKAGEATTLTVVVSGVGNLKSLPEPKRPGLPSARFFESESMVKLETLGEKVGGSKTFKMVLVPRVSGPLEIPPVSVSFYDPAKRAYARAQSKPIRLSVLPGDPNAARPLVGPGASPAPGVSEVAADIRYLKSPNGRGLAAKALAALGAFGSTGPWHALPGAWLVGALLLAWRLPGAPPAARREAFDWPGAALLVGAIVAALLAINRSFGPWLGLVAAALAWAFVRRQRRAARPILDVSLFADPGFAAINLGAVAINLAAFAVMLLAPFYLVGVEGVSVTALGLVLACSATGMMVSAP
ncbi:MAG: BatD family protein, partial [Elusimicrobiota bacterium]|nr:BatD family protein [Elusimicrobiota bacterium]